MPANDLSTLHASLGQSLWLDNLSRELLSDGKLANLIANYGIRGLTSNPAIFKKAIVGSPFYTEDIATLKRTYDEIEAVYEHLVLSDIQQACDLLRPIWDESRGEDGWVSWEESPRIAHDAASTVQAAERLKKLADRPNLLIKVPATDEGIDAFEQLIGRGISVNVTLMFSLDQVQRVFAAYLRGLKALRESGGAVGRVRAVASLFMSRVDTLVDQQLTEIDTAQSLALRGKAALALAGMAYQHFREVFEGEAFSELAQLGARPQYLLWASTGTKNPTYSDVLYVENLIAPKTINTLPEATLKAFAEHGRLASMLKPRLAEDRDVWAQLADAGIDMDGAVGHQLLNEGLDLFAEAFDDLLAAIAATGNVPD
ncbi:transaldolase [Halothiobacillus diazotrophicus]|uniref:Transaldolase n=1 Tax=Halothiobacillus diazotrophicus TaxID=1860122 RepID=A0A191ZKE5_9GAMM|nr:transaldolase [Halothiobacillus diazotrophicus]ANJ68376.1 transaldolase [Halothiobacillus diazotrophicus]